MKAEATRICVRCGDLSWASCAFPRARSHVPHRAPGAGEDWRGQQPQRVRGRLSDWMNNDVVLEGGARDGRVERGSSA
eukprot:14330786-Heterocapsa_arctica.AAC.1